MGDSAEIAARRLADRGFRLEARSPTLGGNVPLRAARSCPPFVTGNAFGLMVVPAEPIRVRRGLRAIEVRPAPLLARALDAKTVELELPTGIALRSPEGAALVVGRAFNRRDRRARAIEAEIHDDEELVVRLEVRVARGEEIEIGGELATVGAFVRAPAVRAVPLARAASLARAHASFFDDAYFSSKRDAPTNKYRDIVRQGGEPHGDRGGFVVAHLGGGPPRLVDAAGTTAIEIASDLDVSLAFHGRRVEATFDPRRMAERAARIERALEEARAIAWGAGAVRYFTTYVTPHAPGDPHVFFKPAVLASSPEAYVLVVDGPDVEGLEGLRGVTESSWFHALPGVGEMLAPAARIARGTTVVRARFAVRALVTPEVAWER